MSEPSLENKFLQLTGAPVRSYNGELVGYVAEITQDKNENHAEYLILESQTLFGRGTRIFAIPFCTSYIQITGSCAINLSLRKDEIQFAKGVAAGECPKPDFNFNPSIFELYDYPVSKQQAKTLNKNKR